MLRTNGINGTSGINGMSNNGKERAPLSKKYKFIPTLNFRHNWSHTIKKKFFNNIVFFIILS